MMARIILSLDDDDKHWLAEEAAREHKSMAEIIRMAIHLYRDRQKKTPPSVAKILKKTSGTWKQGDGLAYQRKLRNEWDEKE